MPALPLQREPKWVGFVNDGWAVDANGKWFYVDRAEWQTQQLRRDAKRIGATVDAIATDLLAGGNVPFLRGNSKAVNEAQAALRRLPAGLLKHLWLAGAKVSIERARAFAHGDCEAAGLTHLREAWVADGCGDIGHVVLHEVGHLVDNLDHHQGVSYGKEWLRVWTRQVNENRVPEFSSQRAKPEEFFAESFAVYFSNRTKLAPAVREFLDKHLSDAEMRA